MLGDLYKIIEIKNCKKIMYIEYDFIIYWNNLEFSAFDFIKLIILTIASCSQC